MKRLLRAAIGKPLRLALNLAGRVYVPGETLDDALAIAQGLARYDIACTLGYFHDWTETPPQLADIACNIANTVAGLNPKGYVSVKAPAFRYDPAAIAAIAESARRHGVLAHFDSHEHATAEPTLACVRHAVELGARVGLTIPGRWRRSPEDAEAAAAQGVRVRIVKGEWADPGAPTLDLREGFLAVVDRLAACHAAEVAVASHDPWLVAESLRRLQAAGCRCEIELLHGLPRRHLLLLAAQFSVPVRVYIPFGVAWRPYALGKAADNPRILWWVVRDSFTGLLGAGRPPRK